MSKKKKTILILISAILIIAISYGILFYFNFFQGFITINNNKISSSALPEDIFNSTYKPKTNFNDMEISPINDVNIKVLGNNISNQSIILKAQRYYIPLKAISKDLNYKINLTSENILISNNVNTIKIFDNSNCTINDEIYNLRGNLLDYNGEKYISISDIEKMFSLVASFNFEGKEISLINKDNQSNEVIPQPTEGKVALIRLEDFTAGDSMYTDTNQMKMKAIGGYLNSNSIKYHIAWVPRFKAPSDNIDNDLLSNNCIQNVGFINLLDYLINNGGMVGLHGYSHQANDTRSTVGSELTRKINNTEATTRDVAENAIDTATALNIPYAFFESPHYHAVSKQKKILEEYFQYLYEPKNPLIYHKLQKTNNGNLYIPTPLSYVRDLNVDPISKKLSNPRPGELASLFYHPTLELDFVEYSTIDNKFDVTYSEDSPLKKIVKSIKENKYVTIHVNQLKNN